MLETLIAQMGIIAVMVGTPGPNNFLLMSSGVHFGVKRTLPLVAGIIVGCLSMISLLAGGLSPVLEQHPQALLILRFLCAGFLLYLVVRLLRANQALRGGQARLSPLGFWRGLAFQWVNPKAWMMCLTLLAMQTPEHSSPVSTLALLVAFVFLSAPILTSWSAAGQSLKGWLNRGKHLLWFNRLTAAALAATIFMLV